MKRGAAVVSILVLAGAASGCSTFSDNDAAARVGDSELTQAQLDELLVAATPGAEPGDEMTLAGDTARELLNTWILTEILLADLATHGSSVDEAATAEAASALEASDPTRWATTPPAMRDLQTDQQAAIAAWSALDDPAPPDDELRALYADGPGESGFVCAAHILLETAEAADAVIDALAAGGDFAELASSESIDTTSGVEGGNLPCDLRSNFEGAYVPEFVDAALSGPLGAVTGPVETEFGFHVIRLRPPEAVEPSELAALYGDRTLRFQRAAAGVDVYVDPRFGAFSPVSGVEALG